MPLHEYRCKKCKHTFEKISKFSDPPVKKCPKCSGPVEQLLSAPAVQFKGSGWYATDYGKGGSGKSATSSDSDSKSSSEKDGGTKSAEKTEKSDKTEKAETKKTESKTESKGKK
ncbi:MAG TPA: zinc ribbon domain-containing protein [Candidatus Angelobacter sp.]|nr:zinc ribbon domain-containing protein [Candidatus Angelobacter sp.]